MFVTIVCNVLAWEWQKGRFERLTRIFKGQEKLEEGRSLQQSQVSIIEEIPSKMSCPFTYYVIVFG